MTQLAIVIFAITACFSQSVNHVLRLGIDCFSSSSPNSDSAAVLRYVRQELSLPAKSDVTRDDLLRVKKLVVNSRNDVKDVLSSVARNECLANVTELDFTNCGAADTDFSTITDAPYINIKKLSFWNNNISDAFVARIVEKEERLPQLESLDLSGTMITDRSLALIFEKKVLIRRIHYLYLRDTAISDAGAEFAIRNTDFLDACRELSLEKTCITDKFFTVLSELASKPQSLVMLSVARTRATEDGLIKAIRSGAIDTVQRLSIIEACKGSKVAQSLIDDKKLLPNLKELYASRDTVSIAKEDELKRSRPGLLVRVFESPSVPKYKDCERPASKNQH